MRTAGTAAPTPVRSPGPTATADQRPPRTALVVADDPRHGLNRYAGVLDAALRAAGTGTSTEVVRRGSVASAVRAARRARRADVVHLQFTDRYFGSAVRQLPVVLTLRLALLGRPVVVTAHDFHTPRREVLAARPRSGRARLRAAAADATARALLGSASLVLTCTAAEQDKCAWTRPRRSAVVPHYVEDVARERVDDERTDDATIVVAGFIHRRKAQHLAVEALAHLPGFRLVLAGSADGRARQYLHDVLRTAAELGVEDRVSVTGYLDDDSMLRVLRRARVALAPYERIAASGSIATVAAVGVPLVVRAGDAVGDLVEACPSAVRTFAGDDPRAVAAAVLATTAEPLAQQRAELSRYSAQRGTDVTARRHVDLYRTLSSPRRARPLENRR
ncbi:glycosyltransferase involved in cell wall biosynthesis [Kineococcus rhizosphaerae]|uniref:Glycosyltransferase involved in cell wall biosynthesis n=1 Tax=Kineococcus rhizosphaerae TaxID=559628 RepID=A0A2T0R131_9ACTN|nr:glycosyltransferase involved in cell wall biosynthesis [Kineococcus rhizosphaerae]